MAKIEPASMLTAAAEVGDGPTWGKPSAIDAPSGDLAGALPAYMVDAFQRSVLFLDLLRRRGDEQLEITAQPMATVLSFDHELVMSGKALRRPINYSLLHITPLQGAPTDPRKRPVVVVDPDRRGTDDRRIHPRARPSLRGRKKERAMAPNTPAPTRPSSKPDAQPKPSDAFKAMALPELEKKLSYRGRSTLAGCRHHPRLALRQWRGRVLGGASSRKPRDRHRVLVLPKLGVEEGMELRSKRRQIRHVVSPWRRGHGRKIVKLEKTVRIADGHASEIYAGGAGALTP